MKYRTSPSNQLVLTHRLHNQYRGLVRLFCYLCTAVLAMSSWITRGPFAAPSVSTVIFLLILKSAASIIFQCIKILRERQLLCSLSLHHWFDAKIVYSWVVSSQPVLVRIQPTFSDLCTPLSLLCSSLFWVLPPKPWGQCQIMAHSKSDPIFLHQIQEENGSRIAWLGKSELQITNAIIMSQGKLSQS